MGLRGVLTWVMPCVVVAACGGVSGDDLFSPPDGDASTTDVVVDVGPPPISKTDKLDILFAIDSSASMGDKQQLLLQAFPQFLQRISSPWCVPQNDPNGVAIPPNNGQCDSGYQIEFTAIKNIHIAIVTSSLGGGGATDVCAPVDATDPTHQNDKARLINRTRPANPGDPEGSVAAAKPLDGTGGNFLAWVPSTESPNVTPEPSEAQLETDFASLVNGVGEHGCGLEAQLESWYRFLVQPDPYDVIQLDTSSPPKATLVGVDATLIKQRHDFLRPDSLVLVVQITDENDSWSDPMWLGGYGWTVRTQSFPGGPGFGAGPRGTSECDQPVNPQNPSTTGPNNPDCVSCAFPTSTKPVAGTPIGTDPNCQACAGGAATCPAKGWYTPASPTVPIAAADGLNVRYTNDMRRRYGLDPQWNIQRYVDGLKSYQVPDRTGENHDSSTYGKTQKNCTNPLFAASLPNGTDVSNDALCKLKPGPRTPDLVYYLVIGGVPWQLLAQDPSNASVPLKRTLGASDWQKILGADPATFQLSGIDPHMIESAAPRPGLPVPGSPDNSDPINGREWNTLESSAGIDLQYACVFDLPQPKDCNAPQFANACDCTGPATNADGPPLCDPNVRTTQIRGKAYPTIRELRVAKGLGDQGVVASICPRVSSASYFEVLFTRIRKSIAP